MKETRISIPELALVAGTRAALGAGLGLLLANRLSNDERRAVGWTLLAIGVLSSVPLGLQIFGGDRLSHSDAPGTIAGRPWSEHNERFSQRSALAPT
jgi:hypothetical protein